MSILTLNDRVAIVTGAAQGMGFETAKKMSLNGMKVAMLDYSKEKLDSSKNKIESLGGAEILSVYCDVSKNDEVISAIDNVANHFHQLDVVVNCAGILSSSKIEDITREEWDRIISINLTGSFFIVQKAITYLKNSVFPRIIFVSSNAGRGGGVESSLAYTASKGGICSITRAMARQLAKYRITVNAVCPGPTRTPITDAYQPEQLENLNKSILIGRLGEPEEMATAICYLASEEASFITGAMLDINGGFWIG